MKYWAFLSYSHTDGKWGDWLHKALETYRIPRRLVGKESRGGKIPDRLFPIFRDREELPVSADLSANINDALNESRYLIVICSPRSAQSRWVGEEIKTFKKLGREDRILALIVDGEPNASEGKPGFTVEEECFHEAMRYRIRDGEISDIRLEPIAADAREGRDGKIAAKLKLIAGLLGIDYDDLRQREQERRLKRGRNVILSALLLVALFAALSIAFLIKEREATKARAEEAKQRNLAEVQSNQRQQLLVESARSDLLNAREKLQRGEAPIAFAYLARSLVYDSSNPAIAGEAIAALNEWMYPAPIELFEHRDQVNTVQFSPNGKWIVTSSNDKTAGVWDIESGRAIAILRGHEKAILDAEWSPDGERVATGSDDNTARVWDAKTGALLLTLTGHSGSVQWVRFSPDGGRIATKSNDKTVRIWDARDGASIASLSFQSHGIHAAQWSPDGQRIVTACDDRTAQVWNARDGKLIVTLLGHGGAVLGAQFSPDGQRVVTASWDKTARVWDAQDGKVLATLEGHQEGVRNAQFSPDGELVVTASDDDTARIWESKTGKLHATFTGHRADVTNVQFSGDGRRLLSFSSDGTAQLWDADSGAGLAIFRGPNLIRSAQFSPDGSRIATAGDRIARVWPAESRRLLVNLRPPAGMVRNLQFSPDGERILTSSLSTKFQDVARIWKLRGDEGVVTLRDRDEKNTKPGLGTVGLPREMTSIGFSPAGDLVVTGYRGGGENWSVKARKLVPSSVKATAKVWNAKTGALIRELEGHTLTIDGAAISADGARIVTASVDRSARIWSLHDGKLERVLEHPTQVLRAQFSPEGERIATSSTDNIVRLWNAQTGQLLVSCTGHTGPIKGIQFSPDGNRLLTASVDRTARIWDAQTGKLLTTLHGHRGSVLSANFCSNGEEIVTAANDRTACIWNARTGALLATLRAQADKNPGEMFKVGGYRVDQTRDKSSGQITVRGDIDVVLAAQFTSDCRHVLTGTIAGAVDEWTIVPPGAEPPPAWFGDFLHYMAQMRLNPQGELEEIPPKDWLVLRDGLRHRRRQRSENQSFYDQILERFVQP